MPTPDDATLVILPESLPQPFHERGGVPMCLGQSSVTWLQDFARQAGFARVVVFRGAAAGTGESSETPPWQWTSFGAQWSGSVVITFASAWLSVAALEQLRVATAHEPALWLDRSDRPICWTGQNPPPLQAALPPAPLQATIDDPWCQQRIRMVDAVSQGQAVAAALDYLHAPDSDPHWHSACVAWVLEQQAARKWMPARVEAAGLVVAMVGLVVTLLPSALQRGGPMLVLFGLEVLGWVRPFERMRTHGQDFHPARDRWRPGEVLTLASRSFLHGGLVLMLGIAQVMASSTPSAALLHDGVVIAVTIAATALSWTHARAVLRGAGWGQNLQLPRLDRLVARLGFSPILGSGRRLLLEMTVAILALCGAPMLAWLVMVLATLTRLWRWMSTSSIEPLRSRMHMDGAVQVQQGEANNAVHTKRDLSA